jgi:anti-sigma regulatory factor (Ser/Thr protein kinase)
MALKRSTYWVLDWVLKEAASIGKTGSVIDLKLRNNPSATRRLRAAVDRIADECRIDDEDRSDLKVAATEAVTNALRAAPGDQTVDVTLACAEHAVDIEVQSAGTFAPEVSLEAERPQDVEGGRGIPLILALVDEVEFARTRAGTRVRMRKRVTRPYARS